MVCMTPRWREPDSNFQFRAEMGGVRRFRVHAEIRTSTKSSRRPRLRRALAYSQPLSRASRLP